MVARVMGMNTGSGGIGPGGAAVVANMARASPPPTAAAACRLAPAGIKRRF